MPGTGIHGYTGPSLYGGNYNISNGIIQSGSGASSSGVASRNSPYGRSVSNVVSDIVANSMVNNNFGLASGVAGNIAKMAGSDDSEYGDLIRDFIAQSQANTAMSQQFAREQMEYQTKSDATAMAWSAAEAQKNRDWQEELSNTAHQREVKDLIAAGLNPILSANNGAYTGSGATGQGFSSSGAMGNVDSTGLAAASSLISARINSASQASVAKMYTDAERYQADLNYSSSRLATEASILNNQNTTSAQKWIASNQMANDLERTKIQGEYGLSEHAMDNQTKWDIQKSQESYGSKIQQNELSQRDQELLGAYERTALELMNGGLYTTGGIAGMAAAGERGIKEILDFLKDPSGTYDKWLKMQKEGSTKGSMLGYIFGFG